MNIFFRVLLAAYAFCQAILSTITMIVTLRPDTFEKISAYINDDIFSDTGARIIMFLVAFIFFILSLTFLLSGFKSNKDKKAVSKHTNIGEIKISLNSIENIALNTAKRLGGIRDSKANVLKMGDSVAVIIKVVVMPDVNIPALSEEIQLKVKKAVEDSAGIIVNEVKVVVDNIITGTIYKPRVE